MVPGHEKTYAEEPVETWYDKYEMDLANAHSLFREALKFRAVDNRDEYDRRWRKANDAANSCLATLDRELEAYRDEDGVLLDDYIGYGEDYEALNMLRHDLLKTDPLDSGSDADCDVGRERTASGNPMGRCRPTAAKPQWLRLL